MKPKLRTRFSPRERVAVKFDFEKDPPKTKQSLKDECDINKIMDRYKKYGELPNLVKRDPIYGDFADAPTYQEAFDLVLRAQEQFDALPAKVRKECHNDPSVFLERVQDPEWAERHALALPKASLSGMPENAPTARPEASGKDPGSAGAQKDQKSQN